MRYFYELRNIASMAGRAYPLVFDSIVTILDDIEIQSLVDSAMTSQWSCAKK